LGATLPDLAAALAHDQPADRLRSVLFKYFRWYRETAPMAEWVHRDRAAVAALDALLRCTADTRLDQLADQLATALPVGTDRRSTAGCSSDWPWTSGRGVGWTAKDSMISPPPRS